MKMTVMPRYLLSRCAPELRAMSQRQMLSLALLSLSLGLSACDPMLLAKRGDKEWAAAPPVATDASAGYPGSIYQRNQNLTLFLDNRARQVGDVITVTLLESTNASKQSTTDTAKADSIAIPGVSLFGRDVTAGGVSLMNNQLASKNSFSGKGSSTQSNSLTGYVSVTVAAVQSNGNLVVRGEKWLTMNQGEEFIRVSGIVRPGDIASDNSVPSWRLSDARITYSGKGALADANAQGWLGRFFNSVFFPL